MNEKLERIPLVVTTAHRGVFFGYGLLSDASTIELRQAKMCVHWTTELKGVCGLAERGPQQGCRVGPAVSRLILRDVTAVMEASPEAAKNWEKKIWS